MAKKITTKTFYFFDKQNKPCWRAEETVMGLEWLGYGKTQKSAIKALIREMEKDVNFHTKFAQALDKSADALQERVNTF